MRTLTRVEKYQKLREEIARMPDQPSLSNATTANSRINVTRFGTSKDEVSKESRSTIEVSIDEIMAGLDDTPTEENEQKLTPIEQQKRKETLRIIILLSILLVLLIGVVILGIIAFK
ncbi:MAG: hypothetical protein EOM74_03190 [Methanomicrobia archaeon]|nr:hypothetical protein [Methanomicrobia archaeon]